MNTTRYLAAATLALALAVLVGCAARRQAALATTRLQEATALNQALLRDNRDLEDARASAQAGWVACMESRDADREALLRREGAAK